MEVSAAKVAVEGMVMVALTTWVARKEKVASATAKVARMEKVASTIVGVVRKEMEASIVARD